MASLATLDGFGPALLMAAAACAWSLAGWLAALRCLGPKAAALAPAAGVAMVAGVAWALSLEWFTGRPGAAGVRLLWIAAGGTALLWTWRAGRFDLASPAALMLLCGIVHVPHGGASVWLSALLCGAAVAGMWRGRGGILRARLRASAGDFAAGIALFLAGFVALLWLRSWTPWATWDPMWSGAEKFGNLMHLASLLQASSAPPGDAWLGGAPMNYYYGGHFAVAALAKAAGAPLGVAFNAGVATAFGLTLASGFGFARVALRGARIPRAGRVGWPLFAAVAIAAFGNLDPWAQIATNDPMAARWQVYERVGADLAERRPDLADEAFFDELERLLSRPGAYRFSRENLARMDWWRSSRAYRSAPPDFGQPGAVTEFPMFSALLGDLHAHHLVLPFALGAWAAALGAARSARRLRGLPPVWTAAAMAALIGWCAAANIWDAVVLAPAYLAALLAGGRWLRAHAAWAAVGVASLLVAAPHLAFFRSPLGESGGPLAPTHPALATQWNEALVFWGLFVVPVAIALAAGLRPRIARRPWVAFAFAAGAFAFLAGGRGVGAGFVLLAGASALAAMEGRRPLAPLLAVGFGWLAFIEVLHFNDAMSGALARYNTVFKIMFPLWGVMAVGAAWALASWRRRGISAACGAAIAVLGLFYPFAGAMARTDLLTPVESMGGRSLDALAWMEARGEWRGDARAAAWLRANASAGDGVLEAPGRRILPGGAWEYAYIPQGRIAAATGLAAPIGWMHHQSQWRGGGGPAPAALAEPWRSRPDEVVRHWTLFARIADAVDAIYEAETLDEVATLIERLGVRWVVVSGLERERYGEDHPGFAKFEALGAAFVDSGASIHDLEAARR